MNWRSVYFNTGLFILAWTISESTTHGNDSDALRAKIAAAHKAYDAIIFKGMAVTFEFSNTYATKSDKVFQPQASVRHIIKGNQTLLIADQKLSGANSDYSFQLAKLTDKYSLTLIESRKNLSQRIQEYEESRRAVLSDSTRIFEHGIVELLDHPGTKALSFDEAQDRVIVRLSFAPGDGKVRFDNVELELDPSNMYQLLSSRDTMQVLATKQVIEHEVTYTYEDQPLQDTELRLLKHVSAVSKYTNLKGKLDEDLQECEFADWSQAVPDDSQFRLSAYGLPEPSLAALNSSSSWLRWSLIALVASLMLGLFLFGKRMQLVRRGE